jgi:hypothetical protein
MPVRRSRFIMGLTASSALAGLPQFAAAQSDATLRVGTVLVQLYGAPYFADEAGSFRKAGFETAITSVNNGPQVAAALAGGSVDLGVIDLISAASAIAKGIPLQLIAGSGLYRSNQPWQVITVAKDSPFRTARDLEGHTIAMVSIAGLALASTRGWLRQNGADPTKVNFVEFQQPAMAAALTRKTFDAAFIGEPFVTFDKNGANEMRVLDAQLVRTKSRPQRPHRFSDLRYGALGKCASSADVSDLGTDCFDQSRSTARHGTGRLCDGRHPGHAAADVEHRADGEVDPGDRRRHAAADVTRHRVFTPAQGLRFARLMKARGSPSCRRHGTGRTNVPTAFRSR